MSPSDAWALLVEEKTRLIRRVFIDTEPVRPPPGRLGAMGNRTIKTIPALGERVIEVHQPIIDASMGGASL